VTTPRIIIIGGGFSGVQCAQVLCRQLPHKRAEIVLFNDENHLVFSPLLAEVVGSSINPLDVVVPLRQLLPRVFCRTEAVESVELATNEITYEAEDGRCARMHYDQLVIACGNVANLNVVPGMADHAFPLKTVGDAAALRSHIMERMEQAEVCPDPERRRWRLTFIVVGGGFSGAEVAGEINDLVRDTARYFRNFTPEEVTVTLIHSRDQILPEISSDLRDFARKKMEKAGVKFLLNARVALATPDGVGLQSGQFVKGGTIVCTIGSSAAPILERLAVPKEKGRLLTQPDMRLRDSANVWAIGDCALVTNAHDGQPSPTTGQFAERQGTQCAQNIVRVLNSQATKPFYFKQLGELCSIGGHSAVADMFGLHLSGFVAWFVWRGVYLFKLPTWARRVQVGFDWAWLLLFPRDLAHLRTRQTDRVSSAHYQPGDVIIKQGDPPSNFYVIKQGEVDVVRSTPNDPGGEVVVVLGPGSFFGEKALLNDEPRVASVRARTAVEVLVLGKNIFSQFSAALAPLRDALAQTLNRRAIDVWKGEPQAFDLLKGTALKELMEPVPQPLLKPEATLTEVSHAFVQTTNEFFYVSSDGASLEGVVTITDLLRGRAAGATSTTPVSEFMTKNPVVLAADDNCAVAATSLREYRLKSLPVVERKDNRRLVGCIRVRRLMARVFKELGN
jgi:NADH dehydrogenase